ncbi:MAG: response regulator [Pyrinomonadaceae bacterium]|nr:response regulator [Pyrinomonadaceae bacterium]
MSLVLVVDDDENIRDTLYELLSEEHRCQTAETAEKALARLDVESYDVVLTDISMPGLSGLELLGHIRQKYPDTSVIVISGISDQEYAQGLIRLGAFDYLLKPFSLEAIMKSVKRALDHREPLLPAQSQFSPVADQGQSAQDEATDWNIVKDRP